MTEHTHDDSLAQYTSEEQRCIRASLVNGEAPKCPRCDVTLTTRPIGGGLVRTWLRAQARVAHLSAMPTKRHIRCEARNEKLNRCEIVGMMMRWPLFVPLVVALACSTDATPKKPVAPPAVVEAPKPINKPPPPEEPLPPMTTAPEFSAISAGRDINCGVTDAQALMCWGRNDQGQIGDGSNTERTLPVAIGGDLKWSAAAAGGSHSCALTTDGVAYCWGSSIAGQLGSDTLGSVSQPYAVQNAPAFAKISAGENHSCAITSAGALWCWGENMHGELGTSRLSKYSPAIQVAPQLTWSSVVAATHHTCGITTEGKLYCWGLNIGGSLAFDASDACTLDEEPEQCALALRQPVDSLRFTSVALGVNHTCAITTAKVLYCWGQNDKGQLGSGFREPLSPTPVMGDARYALVSAGRDFTCALTTAGVAQCWGADDEGQLAGRAADATIPAPIAGQKKFVSLESGFAHSCALGADHFVYCWGSNNRGQLGTGAHRRSFAPARLMIASSGTTP